MPHPISALGAFHTIVSLAPFIAGIYGFIRYHKIDSATLSGKIYLVGLTITSLSSFGLSSTGGFNIGHAIGILALLSIVGALLIPRISFLGRTRPYLSQLSLNFSFFLLLVPGINETLTRLPTAHPFAAGPESPVVRTTLVVWLGIFVLGSLLQTWWTYQQNKRVRIA